MNEKELRYMKYIAEAGSIQKAAVLLQKNPSSLSRAVHRVKVHIADDPHNRLSLGA